MTIRVVAVDDHPLILRALNDLLYEHDDMQLVATCNHGSKLTGLVWEHKPNVAIVDLGMSSGIFDPISTIRNLTEQFPGLKVLVLTGYDDGQYVRELVNAGVSGYILKSDDFSLSLPQAIRAVHEGGKFFSPKIAGKLVADESPKIKLTLRETSVLNLLAQGVSTAAIAGQLGVTVKRVRDVLVTICDKLEVDRGSDVSLRISAINKARTLGLLSNQDPNAGLPRSDPRHCGSL